MELSLCVVLSSSERVITAYEIQTAGYPFQHNLPLLDVPFFPFAWLVVELTRSHTNQGMFLQSIVSTMQYTLLSGTFELSPNNL